MYNDPNDFDKFHQTYQKNESLLPWKLADPSWQKHQCPRRERMQSRPTNHRPNGELSHPPGRRSSNEASFYCTSSKPDRPSRPYTRLPRDAWWHIQHKWPPDKKIYLNCLHHYQKWIFRKTKVLENDQVSFSIGNDISASTPDIFKSLHNPCQYPVQLHVYFGL